MDIRQDVFTGSVVKHWNRLPMEVVGSSFLGVFKRHRCGTYGHGLVLNLALLG